MIFSTTPTLEGHPIREYRGVVTGETIIGANFLKDFMAGIRDFFGGRSSSYEKCCVKLRIPQCARWRNVPRIWVATPLWALISTTKPLARVVQC